jgi:type III secretory pathway component EscS
MTWLGKTFLLCCVVSGAAVSAASIQGLVVGVSDCDTITVLDENRHQHKACRNRRAGERTGFQPAL